jgi:hypothetical protein
VIYVDLGLHKNQLVMQNVVLFVLIYSFPFLTFSKLVRLGMNEIYSLVVYYSALTPCNKGNKGQLVALKGNANPTHKLRPDQLR